MKFLISFVLDISIFSVWIDDNRLTRSRDGGGGSSFLSV